MVTLFDPQAADDFAHLARLRAFIAPMAADAGALVDDVEFLDIADAVYDAFGDLDAAGGLTRSQIHDRCQHVCPNVGQLDERIGLFIRMGMLELSKPHQQRYSFNPTAAAGLMVFARLGEDGGVQEILTLLDRTRAAVLGGTATRAQIADALGKVRRALAVNATHLENLASTRPIAELVQERKHHRASDSLLQDAKGLIGEVVDRFPDLSGAGSRVINEALRYDHAVSAVVDRLLAESVEKRDFSMLDPEQYLTAALTSTKEKLAEPFAPVVFDPPALALDAHSLIDALDKIRPRSVRTRPPRPEVLNTGPDPIAAARERRKRAQQRRTDRVDEMLDGEQSRDITGALKRAGWPRAAELVVTLLAADADPAQPFTIALSDAINVYVDGDVSYLTPITVHRTGAGLTSVEIEEAAIEIESIG